MSGELHIVTGKGGVGKTRLSLLLANQWDALLLENSNQAEYEAKKVGLRIPNSKSFGLQDLLEEFLVGVIKIKSLAHFAAKSKLLQNIVRTAPNLDELLLLGKWVQMARERKIVIDAPSTGNLISIFDSVKTAIRMFDGGFLRKMALELDDFLNSSSNCYVHIVSLPERSALEEMFQIESHIQKLYPKIQVKKVLNRKHQEPAPGVQIPTELQGLAFERPKKEQKRIENIEFEFILPEGAISL